MGKASESLTASERVLWTGAIERLAALADLRAEAVREWAEEHACVQGLAYMIDEYDHVMGWRLMVAVAEMRPLHEVWPEKYEKARRAGEIAAEHERRLQLAAEHAITGE